MPQKKTTMLEYIKSFPANCDIPAGFMTFGELADIIEERNDLLEGMKLIVSIKGNDELAKPDAWSDPRTPEQIDADVKNEEKHPLFMCIHDDTICFSRNGVDRYYKRTARRISAAKKASVLRMGSGGLYISKKFALG